VLDNSIAATPALLGLIVTASKSPLKPAADILKTPSVGLGLKPTFHKDDEPADVIS